MLARFAIRFMASVAPGASVVPGVAVMRAEDVARIVLGIIGALTIDELAEPGSVEPELLGETLALIYAGLVARATGDGSGG